MNQAFSIHITKVDLYHKRVVFSLNLINPLTPKSDWNIISPYDISPYLKIKITRIKEMITN